MGERDDHATVTSSLNTVHGQVVNLAGSDGTVAIVGLEADELSAALAARGCKVDVVDRSDWGATNEAPGDLYDVVVLSGVLRGDSSDTQILSHAASRLARDGRLIVSVANLAHGSRRLALLQGQWPSATGSATTRAALSTSLASAGLRVDALWATVADVLDGAAASGVPSSVVEWVRHQPEALDAAYVAVCRVSNGDEPAADVRISRALPADEARVDDEHSARVREEQEQRHRTMLMRDHVIGLEASLATAGIRHVKAERRANRAEARLRTAKSRLQRSKRKARAAEARARRAARGRRDAVEQIAAMRASRTWRIGRMFTKPFARRGA